jgi:hypothetical protein
MAVQPEQDCPKPESSPPQQIATNYIAERQLTLAANDICHETRMMFSTGGLSAQPA